MKKRLTALQAHCYNSTLARALLALGSLALYSLLFLTFYGSSPVSMTLLSIAPVMLVGAMFGMQVGILGALTTMLLNISLLQVVSPAFPHSFPLTSHGWAVFVGLVLGGALMGMNHDVRARLRADLSDRQRMNESLQAAQASLRNLIASHVDGMLVFSSEGEILFMNPAAEKLWQPRPHKIPWACSSAQEKANLPAELSLVGSDGNQRVVEMRMTPTEWEGKPACLASLRDITQQRSRDRQLRLMHMAIDHASNGIVITDPHQPDNPIVYANPGFERMTGYPASEVVGRNCRFLQRADRDQPALDEIRAALKDQRPCQVLLRNYRKDGSQFWNEVSIRPILNEEGEVVYYVGVQHDVTANLENQARLEYLSSHDSLTGLFNRSYFNASIDQAAAAGLLPATILVADMDGLKQINDSFGHGAGDERLKYAGQVFQRAFRDQDVLARLGGDEFAVLMPATNLYQGRRLLESFRTYLDLYNQENPGQAISFSCGLALLTAEDSAERVLHLADMAMYADKARRKRNQPDL